MREVVVGRRDASRHSNISDNTVPNIPGEETRRVHNDVNELTGIDLTANGTPDLDLTYDDAGNLRIEDRNANTSYRYTHDLWNRLVKIEIDDNSTWEPVAEYEYFGTHWRAVKRSDTTGDQALDEQREMYYSAGWQLLEERIDNDFHDDPGIDRHFQYLWGARYIDDIIWHREDTNGDGDFIDAEDLSWYHLTDVQFSTVAIIDDAANVAERIRYDAYGRALHHHPFDVDGDRDFDLADRSLMRTLATGSDRAIGEANYRVEADINRDGVIDLTDLTLVGTNYEAALPPGELSNAAVKNTIGWDGYIFNSETSAGGMYHVRFRWYAVDLGRWVERDPKQYVDGMNLYNYVASSPLIFLDPSGTDLLGLTKPFYDLLLIHSISRYKYSDGEDSCCAPERMTLVVDFDRGMDLYRPRGTRVPPKGRVGISWLLEQAMDVVADKKCACIESLIIAGHSGAPGSLPIGSEIITTEDLTSFNDPGADLHAIWSTRKSLLIELSSLLCEDATVELLQCNLSKPFGTEFWRLINGDSTNRDVIVYEGTCGFLLGWTSGNGKVIINRDTVHGRPE